MDSVTQSKIQQLQLYEHQMQALLMEKQSLQVDLNETTNASVEVKKTRDDVYKVLGNVMLKVDKPSILQELEDKKKLLQIRINALEKQEHLQEEKAEKLRKELSSFLQKKP